MSFLATPRPRLRRWLGLAALMLVVAVAYVFFASASRMRDWPTHTTFINDQADGFRAGHLHMAVEPPAALLAKPDPFDGANRPLWYWDASLYNGHYYIYWGPVPSLLLAVVKTVFRISASIPDQFPVYALALLQTLAGMLLIDRLARRLWPDLPFRAVALAALVFAFATPTPYNLIRPAVYEAAIVGGHAFALLGVVFAFDAVSAEGEGRRTRWPLLATGIAWMLALGCRLSIALMMPPAILLTAFYASGATLRGRWLRNFQALLWLGTPVALGVFGLLAYNKARFGAWSDFGQARQLTWLPFTMSAAFVPSNIFSYALRPMPLSCKFPFLIVTEAFGARAFPSWFHPPAGYHVGEPLGGLFLTAPWTWFLPVAAVVGARSVWRSRRNPVARADTLRVNHLTLTLGAMIACGMLAELPLWTGTMRYLGDVVGFAIVLATMGAWWLRAWLRDRAGARRVVVALATILGIATILLGILLGMQGQYGHVRLTNPALMDKLEKRLSVCRH